MRQLLAGVRAGLPAVLEDAGDDAGAGEGLDSPANAALSPPKTRSTEYSRATTALSHTAGSNARDRKD